MDKKFFLWSWSLMILFCILSVIDIRFALLALICMGSPLYFSIRGKGKVNCNSYCPRGSFLSNFLKRGSLNRTMPKFMKKKSFKNLVMITIFIFFGISIFQAEGDIYKIAYSIFRMVIITTVISIILGIFYKPRSWCVVCPMGHISGEITKIVKK